MLLSTTLSSSLGLFTLVADDQGLCALHLPNAPELVPPFSDRHYLPPGDNPLLSEACRQLRDYLQGWRQDFQLPLSLHGTTFQQRVWQELRTIPYGSTLTYGALAERMGGRGKARAVGGAAHANPLAIVIPCHRLIGAGGKLTGFSGGLPLKQALLDLERTTLTTEKKSRISP